MKTFGEDPNNLVTVRRVVFYADQKAVATARRAKATVRKLKRNNINVLSK